MVPRSARGVARAVAETAGMIPVLFFTSAAPAETVALIAPAMPGLLAASPATEVLDRSGVAEDGTAGLRAVVALGSVFRVVPLLGTVDERRSDAEATVFEAGDLADAAGANDVRLVAPEAGFRASSVELVEGCDRCPELDEVGAVAPPVAGLRTVLLAIGRVGGLLRALPARAVREADAVGLLAEVVVAGTFLVVVVRGRLGGAAVEVFGFASEVGTSGEVSVVGPFELSSALIASACCRTTGSVGWSSSADDIPTSFCSIQSGQLSVFYLTVGRLRDGQSIRNIAMQWFESCPLE